MDRAYTQVAITRLVVIGAKVQVLTLEERLKVEAGLSASDGI